MPTRPPAEPGMSLDQVTTPALIVDLDALEKNIAMLADRVKGNPNGVTATPHAKAHKCVEIARMQMAAGGSRICCQNVAEAEAMVAGGISSVLLSNEIVASDKARRLAALAHKAKVGVCVDHPTQADILSAAASREGVTLDVLVEIDIGMGRCGIAPGDEAVKLAQYIAGKAGLRFAGLQAYHGGAQHLRKPEERKAAIARAAEMARTTAEMLRAAGLPCDVIAGAGTGTWENELASGIYTELQCGSYALMDADYMRNETASPFVNALFILTTVISHAAPTRAVCDAGLKSMSLESGLPLVFGRDGVTYVKATDEHGQIEIAPPGTIAIGDRLRLVPGHCDPTVNLHDWIVAARSGKVEAVWRVARGW
ncbi:MAG: DSD1 family PLP-dependent enzyme [Bradyrhizobiaceae bacterium]|nr:MAG: DSD1 family PLP-dependent enzyme [Bradyrhizobiaceae bacterium]